jgi:hypothetical protein
MNSLVVLPINDDAGLRFTEWNAVIPKNLAKVIVEKWDKPKCMVASVGKMPTTDFVLERCINNEYTLFGEKFVLPPQFVEKFGMWPQMIYIQMR